jgi:hypothetical protein
VLLCLTAHAARAAATPLRTASAESPPIATPSENAGHAAGATIDRLPPRSFPDLPAPIVDALERRGCSVPQLDSMFIGLTRPHNVVRGRFGRGPERDWAVLCSRDEVSTILVFWDDSTESPAELERRADASYLQSVAPQAVAYSRYIATAPPADIVASHRAHGGPEPPPLTHDGIADGYAEKGSVILYWQDGTWLQLTGAD